MTRTVLFDPCSHIATFDNRFLTRREKGFAGYVSSHVPTEHTPSTKLLRVKLKDTSELKVPTTIFVLFTLFSRSRRVLQRQSNSTTKYSCAIKVYTYVYLSYVYFEAQPERKRLDSFGKSEGK